MLSIDDNGSRRSSKLSNRTLSLRKRIEKRKSSSKKKLSEMPFDQVLLKMKERDCRSNIRLYKEQLRQLKVSTGLVQSTLSHSQLNKRRSDMAERLGSLNSHLALKHRLLNTYVHGYKDKLSLNNVDEEGFGGKKVAKPDAGCTLTIDFNELAMLKQATEEAGFDPYSQYMKMRRDQKL
jgi:hypothetical protein